MLAWWSYLFLSTSIQIYFVDAALYNLDDDHQHSMIYENEISYNYSSRTTNVTEIPDWGVNGIEGVASGIE